MDIINKINNEIGGTTRDGILNNIFGYYSYDDARLKSIPSRFMNAYTKNYIKRTTHISVQDKHMTIIKIEYEMSYDQIKNLKKFKNLKL